MFLKYAFFIGRNGLNQKAYENPDDSLVQLLSIISYLRKNFSSNTIKKIRSGIAQSVSA